MNIFLWKQFLWLWLLAAILLNPTYVSAQDGETRLQVVATFSILGDLVRRVGGERIDLHVLVGTDSDGHLYQPTPADARLLRNANLVIANGLDFEGWMERLIQSSGYGGTVVTASAGITPLLTGSGYQRQPDPHAWQDLGNIRLYIANIVESLSSIAPQSSAYFVANGAGLLHDIAVLEREVVTAIQSLPHNFRTVVTSHDAFAYFGNAYGLTFIAPVGINTDSEASARDVAALIRQIRREKIAAVFVENITDQRLLDQISRETGARVGGRLYSDALSDHAGPAATYIQMMRHNLHTIMAALR